MSAPQMIENVFFRVHQGNMFVYTSDYVLIGQVTSVTDGIHVKLMGKNFRSRKTEVLPAPLAPIEIPLKEVSDD